MEQKMLLNDCKTIMEVYNLELTFLAQRDQSVIFFDKLMKFWY